MITDASGQFRVSLPDGPGFGAQLSGRYESEVVASHQPGDATLDLVGYPLAPAEPAPDALIAWLTETQIELSTAEAGTGLSDMEPLRAIVGDARIVALGEATHGTREFFQLKHRSRSRCRSRCRCR